MTIRIRTLTEAEIAKLPFPDTARAIGGVFELEYAPVDAAQVEALRAQYRIAIGESATDFKTPIIGDSDES